MRIWGNKQVAWLLGMIGDELSEFLGALMDCVIRREPGLWKNSEVMKCTHVHGAL